MRVLLVKLSSLGDVIHNLPVASDLARALPGVEIDWAIEAPYAEIAAMHPAIRSVIGVPLRALKKNLTSSAAWRHFLAARKQLSNQTYDAILDTQGLIKSAWISHWPQSPNGPIYGHDSASAREPFAARFYDHAFDIPRAMHAVERNRLLAARTFGYALDLPLNYGLTAPKSELGGTPSKPTVVFLHATSRADKMWPTQKWIELGKRLSDKNFAVILPWGTEAEHDISRRIAEKIPQAVVPAKLSLTAAAQLLASAVSVIGVDTGLAHLAVALGRPTIGIYLTTDPALTGLHGGAGIVNLGGGTRDASNPPTVDAVWLALMSQIESVR
jgi:heptosyltransferase-1